MKTMTGAQETDLSVSYQMSTTSSDSEETENLSPSSAVRERKPRRNYSPEMKRSAKKTKKNGNGNKYQKQEHKKSGEMTPKLENMKNRTPRLVLGKVPTQQEVELVEQPVEGRRLSRTSAVVARFQMQETISFFTRPYNKTTPSTPVPKELPSVLTTKTPLQASGKLVSNLVRVKDLSVSAGKPMKKAPAEEIPLSFKTLSASRPSRSREELHPVKKKKPMKKAYEKSNSEEVVYMDTSESELESSSESSMDEFEPANSPEPVKRVRFEEKVPQGVSQSNNTSTVRRGRPRKPESLRKLHETPSVSKKRGRPPKRIRMSDNEEEGKNVVDSIEDEADVPPRKLLISPPAPSSTTSSFDTLQPEGERDGTSGVVTFNVLNLNLKKTCPEISKMVEEEMQKQRFIFQLQDRLTAFVEMTSDSSRSSSLAPSEEIETNDGLEDESSEESENESEEKLEPHSPSPIVIPPLPCSPYKLPDKTKSPEFQQFMMFVDRISPPLSNDSTASTAPVQAEHEGVEKAN